MDNRKKMTEICKKCLCNSCIKPKTQCDKCEKCLLSKIYGGNSINEERIVVSCQDYIKDSDETKKLSFDLHVDKMSRYITENAANKPLLVDKLKEYDSLIHSIESSFKSINNLDEIELNSNQIARIDEIDNAIYKVLTVITCNENLKWNIELIGPISDMIVEFLSNKGYIIYYPTIVDQDDGNRTISNFYIPQSDQNISS